MADDVTMDIAEQGYAANPEKIGSWAVAGRALLESILDESHAPNDARSMRTFTQLEVLDQLGSEHVKPLRKWVRTHVLPRHKRSQQEGRVRLTIDDIYAYMEAMELLPSRPEGSKPLTLMIGAYKGGSSKSTATLHLAHYLGLQMWRVLVVDTDPQSTLTKAFGLAPERVDDEATMKPVFDAIAEEGAIPPLPFMQTHFPTVSLTPSNMSLMHADISLAGAFQRGSGRDFFRALAASIDQIKGQFDVILIDTPPAFSLTSVATIYAADGLILPMPAAIPDFAAAFDFCEAVSDLFDSVQQITGEPKVWDPVMVVHSKVDANQTSDMVRQLTTQVFSSHKIDEVIPAMAAVSNAMAQFKSVYEATGTDVDSRSLVRARESYSALGDRLVRTLNAVWARQSKEAGHGR